MNTINYAPIKSTISLDLLNQIDIRVGTIERVEDVTASNNLVKLTVDFGDHKRRIIGASKKSVRIQKKSRASRRCSSSTSRRAK